MLKKDILLYLHDRKTLGLLLVMLVVGIIGALFGQGYKSSSTVTIGIVDNEDSDLSHMLVSYFAVNEDFNVFVNVKEGSEKEIDDSFRAGELDMYFVIPEQFTEDMIHMRNTPVKAVVNSADRTKAVIYKNLLDAYSNYITSVEVNIEALTFIMREEGYEASDRTSENISISWELAFTALGKDDFFERVDLERTSGVALVDYYIYSVLMLLILYGGMITGYRVLSERKSLVSIRLKSCGVSAVSQCLSKIFVSAVFMSVLFILICVFMSSLGNIYFSGSGFLLIIAGVFIACTFFTVLALVINSKSTYCFVTNMLILLMTILGGGIIPVMYLPESIRQVAQFMPNYWFISAMLM